MHVRSSVLLAAALVAGSASAQISSDRPGIALSSSTVGRGIFQVEAGIPQVGRTTFVGVPTANLTTVAFPVALRYGLTRRVELRVSTPAVYDVSRLSSDDPGNRRTNRRSIQRLTLGTKVAVPVSGVSLALVPEVVLEVQGYGRGFGGLRFNAPASFRLGGFGVTLMPGIELVDDIGLNAVGLVSRSFGALTAYAEAGAFPNADFEGSNPTPILAGGGVMARLNANTQLDASFDASLNDDTPDLTLGVGISFRLD